jgi:addiction module RelE/StbE family toxin
MKIQIDKKVDRELAKIKKTNPKLIKRIEKQLALFQEDPKHPSLRTHKIVVSGEELRSISITMSIRAAYVLIDQQTALFVKIGTHEEVYRK